MKNLFVTSILFPVLFFAVPVFADADTMQEKSPRLMVHLLDYLGLDYPGAVQKGKVISQGEYAEMVEFAKTLRDLNQQLPETRSVPSIATDLEALEKLIQSKASVEEVEKLSQDIKWKVKGVSGMV